MRLRNERVERRVLPRAISRWPSLCCTRSNCSHSTVSNRSTCSWRVSLRTRTARSRPLNRPNWKARLWTTRTWLSITIDSKTYSTTRKLLFFILFTNVFKMYAFCLSDVPIPRVLRHPKLLKLEEVILDHFRKYEKSKSFFFIFVSWFNKHSCWLANGV